MREDAMRVPSIGLPVDERRIAREGMRLAEQLLRNYRDPPSLMELAIARLTQGWFVLLGTNRGYRRD
jgi:hypothetical protein